MLPEGRAPNAWRAVLLVMFPGSMNHVHIDSEVLCVGACPL